tara:strand:+ start:4880 stop:5305 length:426 start_codon:yes stop_codon:yes gene_type:complete
MLNHEHLEPGQMLSRPAPLRITRALLASYAAVSGDHNPIHLDRAFARAAGMEDVFAQGMLVMAYAANILTNQVPPHCIRSYEGRFTALTQLEDILQAQAMITDTYDTATEKRIDVKIVVTNQWEEEKFTARAVLVFPFDTD